MNQENAFTGEASCCRDFKVGHLEKKQARQKGVWKRKGKSAACKPFRQSLPQHGPGVLGREEAVVCGHATLLISYLTLFQVLAQAYTNRPFQAAYASYS
jgi:hypothetical protein